MASKSSIAIRRNSAIDRCQDAIRTIWGEEFDLPRRHRDLHMLPAIQLEAIAEYLTCKAANMDVVMTVPIIEPQAVTVAAPIVDVVTEDDTNGGIEETADPTPLARKGKSKRK